MALLNRLLSPVARRARQALGTTRLEAKVDDLQRQLTALQSQLARASEQREQEIAAKEKECALREQELQRALPPPWAAFTLDDGTHYELSIPRKPADDFIESVIAGSTRDDTWQFVIDWVRPGDEVFDLGANLGTFTIPLAMRGARVHAFELLPENAAQIAKSLERNHLQNVCVTIGALWNEGGGVGFGGFSAWGAVYRHEPMAMASLTLDDYVRTRGVRRVDAMKIDIEGSELRALEGAQKLLERDHPDVVIECNAIACGERGYSCPELLRFLEKRGYALYRIYRGRLCPWAAIEWQEAVYADYLATCKPPSEVAQRSGWAVARLSDEERVAGLLAQENYNDYHRAYALAMGRLLPESVRSDARVAAMLERVAPLEGRPFFAMLERGTRPAV